MVVGLVRWRLLTDLPYVLAAAAFTQVTNRLMRRRGRFWEHPSPVTAPAQTWVQLRRLVAAELPGARLQRRLLWRYSLVWTRPAGRGQPSDGR